MCKEDVGLSLDSKKRHFWRCFGFGFHIVQVNTPPPSRRLLALTNTTPFSHVADMTWRCVLSPVTKASIINEACAYLVASQHFKHCFSVPRLFSLLSVLHSCLSLPAWPLSPPHPLPLFHR